LPLVLIGLGEEVMFRDVAVPGASDTPLELAEQSARAPRSTERANPDPRR